MQDYLHYFKKFSDFPKPGVLFYDASPLFYDPALLKKVVLDLAKVVESYVFDVIAGVDARGFILGAMLAMHLNKGFIMMRKSGKLPGKVAEIEYGLEYGKNSLAVQHNILKPHQKILIVDDVLATGGTASASAHLVEAVGAEVAALVFLLELPALNGRALLEKYSVHSLVSV